MHGPRVSTARQMRANLDEYIANIFRMNTAHVWGMVDSSLIWFFKINPELPKRRKPIQNRENSKSGKPRAKNGPGTSKKYEHYFGKARTPIALTFEAPLMFF